MISLKCPVCGNPVDEAIDGGCSKRCDDIFHGVEEMTDDKAALDALDRLAASITQYDRHPDIVKQDIDIVRQALTTPPAPTVMGDDVREAVKTVRQFISITSDSLTNHAEIQAIETLIRAATQPREPEPKACPACKGEPESGFIEMDNNGPIVPCRTCNSDPESCADVPSLRHCEAANRETATQPPQATDAQRQEATDILNKVEYYVLKHDPRSGIKDPCDKAMLNRAQIDTIKAALQSPAVPRE